MLKTPLIGEFDEYIKRLVAHDWTHEYSDDASVYRRGRDRQRDLEQTARSHSVYQQAFNAYSEYTWKDNPGGLSAQAWANRKVVRDDTVEALRRYVINNQPVEA